MQLRIEDQILLNELLHGARRELPPTALPSIAAALDLLATNPDHANALAQRARQTAERRFTWDSVAEEWLNAYELG